MRTPAAALDSLLDEPLPDPYVCRSADEWHIFGTGARCYHGRSLEAGPLRGEALQLDLGPEAPRVQDVWKLTPHCCGDAGWQAYGTLHYGQFRTVIAHFEPAGCSGEDVPLSWRMTRVILGSLEENRTTCYDPLPFTAEDGRLYLLYSAAPAPHSNVSILLQRMLDPVTPDPAFEPRVMLAPEGYRSEDRNPGYIQLVEGANLARLGEGYALLYSVGDFSRNNYKLGIAFSDQLIPPPGQTYRKVTIPDPGNLWRNSSRAEEVCYLLQSEHKGWPNYCGHLVRGPGLGNLLRCGDEYRLVFHGYRPDDSRRDPRHRFVWSLPVAVDLRECRPAWHRVRPVLPRG